VQNDRSVVVRHEAAVLERRGVRNTSGITENRYVIREELVLGDQSWPIELTLTNRDAMGFRMLLGREAMVGRVLVDPEGSHQLGEVSPDALQEMYAHLRTERTGLRVPCWPLIRSCTATGG
jgi:ribosomal protein S6--L-glutamate ligase